MTTIEQLVGEFVDAWNAGRRPDVAAFLARAAAADRDDLAAQLASWLDIAPTPDHDDATRAAIAGEPALVAALDAAATLRTPLAMRIRALRAGSELAIRDVAAAVAQRFALDDEARIVELLMRLERDDLDERRVSGRLLDALAAILGATRAQLAPSPSVPGAALFRTDDEASASIAQELDALSRAALSPAPVTSLDELDRLFLGGPDG